MNIKDLQGKLVAVLGFGVEGRATINYLIKHGVKPVLFDSKPWEQWSEEDKNDIKSLQINFIFGPDYLKELKGFDVVFRSPGIKLSIVKSYASNVAILTSQTKWFFEHCPSKIIGVTGTKGKGTTSTLIYEILKQQFPKVHLIGNIGKTQAFEILDDLSPNDLIIYELSSFQLQDLTQSPHIAVVLMTTSEHLDYHKDIEEYHQAKTAISKFQSDSDFTIFNIDYSATSEIGNLGQGTKIKISTKQSLKEGCFIENDLVTIKNISGQNYQYPITNIQLPGRHNLENICAASAVATILNVDFESLKTAVENFKGLEHRLEFIGDKNGIKYYNDSFSTIPETTIAAINAFEEPEIVILGGSSKNSDFTNLGQEINHKKNIKAIILIGAESGRIKQSIEQAGGYSGKYFEGAKNMEEIFLQIWPIAAVGDVVLLSPACASFGMFKNYKDRGQQFKLQFSKL